MAKLYMITDPNSQMPFGLSPTKKVAREEGRIAFGKVAITAVEVTLTRKGVCDFIHQHYGTAIFENA